MWLLYYLNFSHGKSTSHHLALYIVCRNFRKKENIFKKKRNEPCVKCNKNRKQIHSASPRISKSYWTSVGVVLERYCLLLRLPSSFSQVLPIHSVWKLRKNSHFTRFTTLRAKQAYKPWKSSVFCFQNGVSFDKKMNCIIGQLSIAYHKSVVYNNCEERSKSNQ